VQVVALAFGVRSLAQNKKNELKKSELYNVSLSYARSITARYFGPDGIDSESTIETVLDGTCAANSAQWIPLIFTGMNSHVN